jgi:hypothetical protein
MLNFLYYIRKDHAYYIERSKKIIENILTKFAFRTRIRVFNYFLKYEEMYMRNLYDQVISKSVKDYIKHVRILIFLFILLIKITNSA